MKAISIEAFGGPEVCRLTDAAEPRPAAGEVTVQLAYAGINFMDIYMRNGTYARSHTYKTPLPMAIGMEGAGTVTALGHGVSEHAIGDRVGFCLGPRQLRRSHQCAGVESGSDSRRCTLLRCRSPHAARLYRALS